MEDNVVLTFDYKDANLDKYYRITDDECFKELPIAQIQYAKYIETLTQHEADLLQHWWSKHSKTPEQRVELVIDELLSEVSKKMLKKERYYRMLSAIVVREFVVKGGNHED